jgi:hypothetical protein
MVSPKKRTGYPSHRLLPNGRTSIRNGFSVAAVTIAEPVELLLLLGVKAVVKSDRFHRSPRSRAGNRATESALE